MVKTPDTFSNSSLYCPLHERFRTRLRRGFGTQGNQSHNLRCKDNKLNNKMI